MSRSLAYLFCVSGILIILLGGCGGSSGSSSSSGSSNLSFPPLTTSLYFPLIAGSVYQYSDSDSQTSTTSSYSWTVQPQTVFQGQAAIPILVNNQQQTYANYFTVSSTGAVSLIGGKDSSGTYDLVGGSWLLIPTNPTNQTWTFVALDTTNNTHITNNLSVVGITQVTVPAGTFSSALQIHDAFQRGTSQVTNDYWYAPNVGLVKDYEVDTAASGTVTTFTTVLNSYTAGG